MSLKAAKNALDAVIKKSRIHFYKPLQIAEILYRDRTIQDINLADLETYRKSSKQWRNVVCQQFLGRVSSSSSKYQDDIFDAVTPAHLVILGNENRAKNGIVEAYIYKQFLSRFSQVSTGLQYCLDNNKETFSLSEFLDLFWNEPGLRRSIDKIYEIVVYSLFSALVEALEVEVEVSMNPAKSNLLKEFEDFAKNVIQLTPNNPSVRLKARINRVGVTNAADRGLDMWANFGLAIQIKHLSLTEEMAENIVSSVSADRIVIVCKDTEQKVIVSLLTQIGWKSKIQSIVTETNLLNWYERALRGTFASSIGDHVMNNIRGEIAVEFPATNSSDFKDFYTERGYDVLSDKDW